MPYPDYERRFILSTRTKLEKAQWMKKLQKLVNEDLIKRWW